MEVFSQEEVEALVDWGEMSRKKIPLNRMLREYSWLCQHECWPRVQEHSGLGRTPDDCDMALKSSMALGGSDERRGRRDVQSVGHTARVAKVARDVCRCVV